RQHGSTDAGKKTAGFLPCLRAGVLCLSSPRNPGKKHSRKTSSRKCESSVSFVPHRMENAMYVGYARVSTQDQHLDLQQDALQQAGCTRIIVDRVSGTVAERPGLAKLKDILRADDTLVVWRLDRLGRSLKDLIAWVAWLEQEGIGLRSLHEALDTTTSSGKLTFHIFAALAEFE